MVPRWSYTADAVRGLLHEKAVFWLALQQADARASLDHPARIAPGWSFRKKTPGRLIRLKHMLGEELSTPRARHHGYRRSNPARSPALRGKRRADETGLVGDVAGPRRSSSASTCPGRPPRPYSQFLRYALELLEVFSHPSMCRWSWIQVAGRSSGAPAAE